jgi:peptide/nickel transport system permease protein
MKNSFASILSKRIFTSLIILLLLVSFVFILLRVSPGDISQKFIAPGFDPQLKARVIESFGLNKSLPEQYYSFITSLAKGELGISYNFRVPVVSVISEYLPFTLIFALSGFLAQVFPGMLLAVFSVKHINSKTDKFLSGLTLVIYSFPTFVVGVFLIYIFSVVLDIFPSSGFLSFNHDSLSTAGKIADYIKHLALPLLTLALGGITVYFKYLRDNLEQVLNSSYIFNLRANGIDERRILLRHVLPNAVNPLISVAGVELGILFSGALITEVIFGLPGMGRLSVNAILSRDYPLVAGCTLTAGTFVVLCNMAADLVKAMVDKRLLKEVLN